MGTTGVIRSQSWIEQCVRLVLQRVPDVDARDAQTCAEEMARAWPELTPDEAVRRYFEDPRFDQTDWSVFELK